METFLRWLHRYVSPVFLVMLVASFILWYIAKLSYTYTTEYVVSINTDGEKYKVACIFEGVGTNLVSYHTSLGKSVKIPLSELKYKKSREEGHEGMLIIDPQSLQHAIAVRFSDVKVSSIGAVPEIPVPENHD
ncbi:hypothetical protein [uncultured Alistipes sp.]|uniref:hypothetical protein n=1 Tax=uncultured Alistipes sp. TaxID=538949 RepID=UPI0025CD5374|nr:hypothetical protein [uncultured Alistipes sp.]